MPVLQRSVRKHAFLAQCLHHQFVKQDNAYQRMLSVSGSSPQPRREAWEARYGRLRQRAGSPAGGASMSVSAVRARLYPDYGGSPLWLPLRRLDWDEIKVSPELYARLKAWVDDYEHDTTKG